MTWPPTCYYCRQKCDTARAIRLRAGRLKQRGRKRCGFTAARFFACGACRDQHRGKFSYA